MVRAGPVDVECSAGRRREFDEHVEKLIHAEVQRRRGEQDRCRRAAEELLTVVVGAVRGQQFGLLDGVIPVVAGGTVRVARHDVLFGGRAGSARGAGEPDEAPGPPV